MTAAYHAVYTYTSQSLYMYLYQGVACMHRVAMLSQEAGFIDDDIVAWGAAIVSSFSSKKWKHSLTVALKVSIIILLLWMYSLCWAVLETWKQFVIVVASISCNWITYSRFFPLKNYNFTSSGWLTGNKMKTEMWYIMLNIVHKFTQGCMQSANQVGSGSSYNFVHVTSWHHTRLLKM